MKRVFYLIIVDESGSMSTSKRQVLMGLNVTIKVIGEMQELNPDIDVRVTLITFNSSQTKYVFDNVPASKTHLLTSRDYCPNGATPLCDAIGISINKLNAQTNAEGYAQVTIITDGEENASKEYSPKMLKTLINKLRRQKWSFEFIDTDNLDVENMVTNAYLVRRFTDSVTIRRYDKRLYDYIQSP